jgi:hypothetical protein
MLEFLIDNIFVVFGNEVFQQTVGIPMGTNCAPLLANMFLYSFEAEFIQKLLFQKNKSLVAFNSTFRYMDDVLTINNEQFHSYVDSLYCKTNTIPVLMHQMRISTNKASSVMLRPKKLENRNKNV